MSIWTRIGFVYQDSIYCDACAVAKFGSRIIQDSPGASQDFEGQSVTPYLVASLRLCQQPTRPRPGPQRVLRELSSAGVRGRLWPGRP